MLRTGKLHLKVSINIDRNGKLQQRLIISGAEWHHGQFSVAKSCPLVATDCDVSLKRATSPCSLPFGQPLRARFGTRVSGRVGAMAVKPSAVGMQTMAATDNRLPSEHR